MPGVTVELLDDEGDVIATTVTEPRRPLPLHPVPRNGRLPGARRAAGETRRHHPTTKDVLISRGGVSVSGYNFGLRLARGLGNTTAVDNALSLNNNWQTFA